MGEGENTRGPPLGDWTLLFGKQKDLSVFLVGTWIPIRMGHRHIGQGQASWALAPVHFLSRGQLSIELVGRFVGDCLDVANLPGKCLFISLVLSSWRWLSTG